MVTPQRSIRINEELWRKAKEKAESEGKNISEVIVAYLKDYAQQKAKEPPTGTAVGGSFLGVR